MQFAIDLIGKIPAGWPRLLVMLSVVVAYFFFPSIYRKLVHGKKAKEDLALLNSFLQAKKLYLETEALQKDKGLAAIEFPGEARLISELRESSKASQKAKERVPYLARLKYSLIGAGVFLLIDVLVAFGLQQERALADMAKFVIKNLGFSLGCGLLGSLIPLGSRITSFLYGLTMPFALILAYSTLR